MRRQRIQVDFRTRWFRPMALLPLALAVASLPGFGQQTYVSRFDLFTGYTHLDSPLVSLQENGFHFQTGVRANTWLSLGFDYSISGGDLTLTPNLLLPSLQQELGAELGQLAAAGEIPAGYSLVVPAHSRTQTFAAGPQFSYRHFSKVTLSGHPRARSTNTLLRNRETPSPPASRRNWRPPATRWIRWRSTASAAAPISPFRATWGCGCRPISCTTICSATCSRTAAIPSASQSARASTSAAT